MELEDDLQARVLTPHEIDTVASALAAYRHIQIQAEAIGDAEEGYITIPEMQDLGSKQI